MGGSCAYPVCGGHRMENGQCSCNGSATVHSPASAKDEQVGGDHYKDMPIQPVEFIYRNGIDYLSGNVIKYMSRHKMKGGAKDVRKAIHYCQMILEMQYGEQP